MKSSLYPVQDLHRRALAWALKLKVNPRRVRVQAMRHKWGSCSSAGTVTLASDLLDQGVRFQDYVIVHELLHLRYATHGRVFKALMSAHVPGWQAMEERRMYRRDLAGASRMAMISIPDAASLTS
ncbi:MAG: M48 family metallopeptidase [Proteobacteria bacterium]|nr:M48 family metallopeptidase [Pseudomonadota bacterium]